MAKFYKSRYTAAQQDALLDIVEQGGSGGEGGGSIEGEYFLVKAQDFYWKPSIPVLESMTYDMAAYQAYNGFATVFTEVGSLFEAISFNKQRCSFKEAYCKLYDDHIDMMQDSKITKPIIAIREGNIDSSIFGLYNNLVEMYIAVMEAQGAVMTESEVIALLEETMCIVPITQDEYESLITA